MHTRKKASLSEQKTVQNTNKENTFSKAPCDPLGLSWQRGDPGVASCLDT